MNKALNVMFKGIGLAAEASGTPLGTIAAQAISKITGEQTKPADVKAKVEQLAMSDDGLLKLKKIEADYQLALQEHGLESEDKQLELAAADRDSARKREVEVDKTGRRDWTPTILAMVVTIAWVASESFLLRHALVPNAHVAPDMVQIVSRVQGLLDAALVMVLGYYFGSSAGSARKSELMAQANPAQN